MTPETNDQRLYHPGSHWASREEYMASRTAEFVAMDRRAMRRAMAGVGSDPPFDPPANEGPNPGDVDWFAANREAARV